MSATKCAKKAAASLALALHQHQPSPLHHFGFPFWTVLVLIMTSRPGRAWESLTQARNGVRCVTPVDHLKYCQSIVYSTFPCLLPPCWSFRFVILACIDILSCTASMDCFTQLHTSPCRQQRSRVDDRDKLVAPAGNVVSVWRFVSTRI